MKTKFIALLTAFWASLSLFVILALVLRFYKFDTVSILLVSLCQLVVVFFIVRYWIQKEVYDKVRTIYKNIYNFKINKKDLKTKINSGKQNLSDVHDEVDHWIEEQTGKIDQMVAMEKYRKEYIGDVSHELKTPIFTIQGYISTLLDGAMEEKELTRKYLQRTEAGIERMIAIVNDLDTISQLESGEIRLDITRFDILKLAQETADSLEQKAKEHNLTIQIQYNEPLFVEADRNRIRQVLTNLLDNAIKYSKPDSGIIKIKFFDMGDQALIEVADKGIGVAEKDLPRLFERFYRTDKARSRQNGGCMVRLCRRHRLGAGNRQAHHRSTPPNNQCPQQSWRRHHFRFHTQKKQISVAIIFNSPHATLMERKNVLAWNKNLKILFLV